MSTVANSDISSHEHFFSFVNSDDLLNEFLWRADRSVNRLRRDVVYALRNAGFPNLRIGTNVTHSGVYINMLDSSGKRMLHISFHLQPSYIQPPQSPGAIHAMNNFANPGVYQMFYVVQRLSVCNPGAVNGLNLLRSSYDPNMYSSICGSLDTTVDIILGVVNRYFKQPTEPLSLYHNLSGRRTTVHPQLMPIIRSRPHIITRTALTAGLAGGAKSRYSRTRNERHRRRLRSDHSTRRRRTGLSRSHHYGTNP